MEQESQAPRPSKEDESELVDPAIAPDPPAPETRVSLAEFLAATDLPSLEALYAERGETASGEALLKVIQDEWHRLAMWEARRTALEPPPRFEPERVRRGKLEVSVYGVIHGMFGGDDKSYSAFVKGPLSELKYTVFENGLSYMYPWAEQETIPDFGVSGPLGSLAIGFMVGKEFPLLMWELITEVLKIKRGGGDDDFLAYDARFHAIDPEVRRGVEPSPPLPSRVQIDYEMTRWNAAGWKAGWKDPAAIVPRSMFMAGYAVGSAERRKVDKVALVVGDLHTMEIVRFLQQERCSQHPLFQAGRQLALRPALRRKLAFYRAKIVHLLAAGLAGSCILVPVIFLLMFAYDYLLPWWSS